MGYVGTGQKRGTEIQGSMIATPFTPHTFAHVLPASKSLLDGKSFFSLQQCILVLHIIFAQMLPLDHLYHLILFLRWYGPNPFVQQFSFGKVFFSIILDLQYPGIGYSQTYFFVSSPFCRWLVGIDNPQKSVYTLVGRDLKSPLASNNTIPCGDCQSRQRGKTQGKPRQKRKQRTPQGEKGQKNNADDGSANYRGTVTSLLPWLVAGKVTGREQPLSQLYTNALMFVNGKLHKFSHFQRLMDCSRFQRKVVASMSLFFVIQYSFYCLIRVASEVA